MRFAIIAAGAGSRLKAEGFPLPKPLVEVRGEPLIGRLLRIFSLCSPTAVDVIVSPRQPQVSDYLRRNFSHLPLHILEQETLSSLHSLDALSDTFSCEKCCVTTVDTFFSQEAFLQYMDAFQRFEADAYMGVTDFIDDEKPLYVSCDANGTITRFSDEPPVPVQYVSAGLYGLTPSIYPVLKEAVQRGMQRMRNFQRDMLSQELRLELHPLGTVFDIDHLSDIARAESSFY